MKVSLNWAQWHSNVDLRPGSIGELTSLIGRQLGEVENVYSYGQRYEGIVIAKVISCVKHPDADKLSLCMIDDGKVVKNVDRNDEGFVQVVCGAPNVKSGMLVAWIPPGVVVPSTYEKDPFKLEAREIRGKVSNGMLASPSELDINDEHDGILEINPSYGHPEQVRPGAPLKNLYGLDDVIIDIENKVFTHRPDCFGVLGVARELAGIQKQKFESPDWYLRSPEFKKANALPVRVVNKIPDLTPRFMAVSMRNVKVEPSPVWLQAGLRRVGIKSINNVVDVTNYLMYVTGQPTHAYDYDKVASLSNDIPTLHVRYPKKGEKIALLNGKTIEPSQNAICIASDKELVGIGGVMGGTSTEVDNNTKNIIIECASFDLYSIRRSSMEHGLFTDAVTRFSKGQSPLQNDRVLAKALELVCTQADGKQASEVVDDKHLTSKVFSSQTQVADPIRISSDFINNRLGLNLKDKEIIDLLTNVEIDAYLDVGEINVNAPFWRTDIEIPEDIVEEVGRLYGYDNLPLELPNRKTTPSIIEPSLIAKKNIRELLASLGATETLNHSFINGKVLKKARQNSDESYELNNALSPELQYYRQSLTPSLLAQIHPNIKAGFKQFALFELNKVHNKVHGLNKEKVPGEINMVALSFASKSKTKGSGYFYARKYLEALGSKLGIKLVFSPVKGKVDFPVTRPYNLQRSALVTDSGSGVFFGIVGEYHNEAIKNFKLPEVAAGFEIGLDAVLEATKKDDLVRYKVNSRFPSISQDICLQVSPDINFAQLANLVGKAAGDSNPPDVATSIEPIDIYQPKDKSYKNITFNITLVSFERTLKEEIASKLLEQIAQKANKELAAKQV